MGQKVNPHGLRLGIIKDWSAKWFPERGKLADYLHEDLAIRELVKEKMYNAGIGRIDIQRVAQIIKIDIHTARPGMVIGRGGTEVDALRKELENLTSRKVIVNVEEIKNPDLDAQLVAENVASQLEKRVSFRRAMKQALTRTMRMGAEGFRIQCSGRLAGADMARREGYSKGNVPLHTLRADIDYGFAVARTTFGAVGVKVWINKGEVLPQRAAVSANE